jgi:DNA invertase Pin-like site-specific DNA recombinase
MRTSAPEREDHRQRQAAAAATRAQPGKVGNGAARTGRRIVLDIKLQLLVRARALSGKNGQSARPVDAVGRQAAKNAAPEA